MKKILLNTLFCFAVLTTQHSVAQMGVPRCNESLWKDDYSANASCNVLLDNACTALNGARMTPDFEAAYAILQSAINCDSIATGSANEFFSVQLRKIKRYIDQVKEIDSLNGKESGHPEPAIATPGEAKAATGVSTQANPDGGASGSASTVKAEAPHENPAGQGANSGASQQNSPSQPVPDTKDNVQKSGDAPGGTGGAIATGVVIAGAAEAPSNEKNTSSAPQEEPVAQPGTVENKTAGESTATDKKSQEESNPPAELKQTETKTETAGSAGVAAVAVVQKDTQPGEGMKANGEETGPVTAANEATGSSNSGIPAEKSTETSQAAVAVAPAAAIPAEQKVSSMENKKNADVKVLTPEEQQEYQLKGLAKVHELEGYLKQVANKNTNASIAADAIANAMKLFYDVEERFIQVSSLNNPETPKFSVRRYFERLRLLNYEQVEIEWVNFQYTSDFLKGEDGLLHGYVEFQQTFTATKDNRIVYSDLTTKKEEIILVQYKKAFEGVETEGFDVFLGDMSVVQTSSR